MSLNDKCLVQYSGDVVFLCFLLPNVVLGVVAVGIKLEPVLGVEVAFGVGVVPGALLVVDGVVGALLPVDVVPSALLLVDGVVGTLLLVGGVVGALMLVGVVPGALLLVETVARIIASWTAEDGSIDISAPSRPGIVNCYVVHSVKLNGELYQHVFAVSGGTKLIMNKIILAILLRFGNAMIMYTVDPHSLCQCSA